MAERIQDQAEHDRRWIAEAAYFRWLARGSQHGGEQDDWLQAECDFLLHSWFDWFEPSHPCSTFLVLSHISYAFGVIGEAELLERDAYHGELFHDGGEGDEGPPHDEPPLTGGDGDLFAPEEDMGRLEMAADESARDSGESGPDWLQFMPFGPVAHLKLWRFHEHDRDPVPSVPHGHFEGKPHPKLDPYLGWIDDGPNKKKNRRLPKKETRALWNDQPFRDFALRAIRWFIADRKSQHVGAGWRVTDPLRLPRRR